MFHCLPKAAAVLSIAVLATAGSAASQDSKSAPLARELVKALDAAKADSIGASDPETGGFVAAIYVPGTQLLVVGGKFQSPDIGHYRLSKKEFRELYMDLNGGSEPTSRMFASDIRADGLALKPSGGVADVWEFGTSKHEFAGAKKAKLKDQEYAKVYSEADTHYARILSLLIAQTKMKGTE
jgi:hypothetical protein